MEEAMQWTVLSECNQSPGPWLDTLPRTATTIFSEYCIVFAAI